MQRCQGSHTQRATVKRTIITETTLLVAITILGRLHVVTKEMLVIITILATSGNLKTAQEQH